MLLTWHVKHITILSIIYSKILFNQQVRHSQLCKGHASNYRENLWNRKQDTFIFLAVLFFNAIYSYSNYYSSCCAMWSVGLVAVEVADAVVEVAVAVAVAVPLPPQPPPPQVQPLQPPPLQPPPPPPQPLLHLHQPKVCILLGMLNEIRRCFPKFSIFSLIIQLLLLVLE